MPQGGAEQLIGTQRLDQSGLKSDVSGANSILQQMHATMQKTAQDMAKGFDAVTASIKEMQSAMAGKGKGSGGGGGGSNNAVEKYISRAKKALTELRSAYTSVNSAITVNDKKQEEYWRSRASSISQSLNALTSNAQKALNKGEFNTSEVKKYSDAIKDLREQMRLFYSVRNSKDAKTTDTQRQVAEVKQISDAYKTLQDQIQEYRRAMQTGDTGTAASSVQKIQEIMSQYDNLESKLSGLTGSNYKQAETALRNMSNAAKDFFATLNANKQQDTVQQIKDAYDDLVRSIREYNVQIESNDLAGADKTRSHIDTLISQYSELEKIMSSSGLSGRNLLNAESALQKMNVEAQKFFATLEASRQQTVVQQIKDAYDDLVRSIKEYNSQVESGDYANANKTKQHIDELIRSYKELEEMASKSGLSEEKLRDVNAILQNMRTAMNNFTKSVQDANNQVSTMDSLLQQAGERLLQMANQAILRGLSTMWREAISYTKTYYDSLNEIRIVTMRSQEEANALGAQYRENAREQSVTSAEYVEGAASLFRQGLGDADVEGRLRQITVAAKTWGLDVAQTTELMTVAINAFNDGMEDSSQTAERIADVYSYVGRQNCPLAA